MSELSKRWTNLPPEEQRNWKRKAEDGSFWLEQPKKRVVRDLSSSIEDNVCTSNITSQIGTSVLKMKSLLNLHCV